MAPFNRARLEQRNFIDLNVFMHRRESFERFGGFNESMRRLVDWELILRYTAEQPPAFLPVTLGRYRIARADNRSRSSRITSPTSPSCASPRR